MAKFQAVESPKVCGTLEKFGLRSKAFDGDIMVNNGENHQESWMNHRQWGYLSSGNLYIEQFVMEAMAHLVR